jgi:hypothetical protein
LRAVLAAAAGTLVFAGPTLGVRQAQPGSHGNLRDFVKSGAISKPTAAQRAGVRALHAKVTWNNYGTPATLMGLRRPLRGSRLADRRHGPVDDELRHRRAP